MALLGRHSAFSFLNGFDIFGESHLQLLISCHHVLNYQCLFHDLFSLL